MSLKMKKILAVSAVVVIGIVIAVVVIFTKKNEGDSTVEKLALAKQYYDMMDYDKSAAIYNQLLKSNSAEPDIYMGLYDVYMVMGKEEKAIEILERGANNTSNKAIEDKLAKIYSERGYENEESSADSDVIADETEISVSESLVETTIPSESQSAAVISVSEETETASETVSSVTTTQSETTTTKRPETTTKRSETTTARPVVITTARPVTTVKRTETTTVKPVTTTKITTTKAPEPVGEYEIRQHNISDYVLTRDQIKEMGIKSNTIIKVKASNAILYFNSSVFDEVYSVDLSVSLNHTTTRTTVKFKDNKLPCDVKVVVTSSNMNSRTLKLAHLFYNDKDNGVIKLDGDGNPVFTAKGGTYTIERVEEKTTADSANDSGYVVIGVGNISKYKLTSDELKGVGSNRVIQLKSNNVEMYLNSSVFEKQDEVDVGVVITNTSSKAEIEFNNSSSFGCEVKVVLITCDMHARTLSKAHIYRNGVDLGAVKLTADGDPYFTASSGGKYVIRVPEE